MERAITGVRMHLAAAALSVLVLALLALGARCMSLTQTRCAWNSLWTAQPRLDVPYAGTRPEVIAAMLHLAAVGPGDHVIDLGTGDGRILTAAARDRGASGLGVDLDPVLIRDARAAAERAGVASRVQFRTQDLFATALSPASVVTMFLLPEVNLRLRPRILAELEPGSRVVSHAFDMGEWQPDAAARAGGARVYLWVVPAQVSGEWQLTLDGRPSTLHLTQEYQRLSGRLETGQGTYPLRQGLVRGTGVSFILDLPGRSHRFLGRLQGHEIGWLQCPGNPCQPSARLGPLPSPVLKGGPPPPVAPAGPRPS